jgi:MvaI/BcnI restriction endonuclease family
MIEKADIPLNDVISLLSKYNIAASYLVPTPTGMEKSIMDATAPLRGYLKENNIHNYDEQFQGAENKKIIEAKFIFGDRLENVKISFYRPETKSGDPRIWIYGLTKYAKSFNLISMFVYQHKLYIFNASQKSVLESIHNPHSPLGEIAYKLSQFITDTAAELLAMLRERTGDRFIPSVRNSDSSIGDTLEKLLGIKPNSNKAPDYKGIEIKSSRQDPKRTASKNRVNLFSQVPDWKSSPIGTAINMLNQYGYITEGRLQLYCSLDAVKPNSQRLMLSVDENAQLLRTIAKLDGSEKSLMIWALSNLKVRLQEKHPESFWVKAETKIISGQEHFRYYKVIHTTKPIVSNLDYLLADGTISLDLTMSQKTHNTVRDHGYLFKIWPEDFHTLFPLPLTHELL